MWSKSVAALFGGCLLSITLMLNLNYLLTYNVDTKLFIGLLIGFPIWVGAMVACYAANSALQAWKRCAIPFAISALINVYYFLS
jgi:hypothetical protein